jgi:hypothetical protein
MIIGRTLERFTEYQDFVPSFVDLARSTKIFLCRKHKALRCSIIMESKPVSMYPLSSRGN